MSCLDCSTDKPIWAKNLCHSCYMKKWRRDHPNDTVKGLRKEIERLKREVVYARDEGRDEMAKAIGGILVREGSNVTYDGDVVKVLINDRWVEKKL